jgi:uncharacterized protein YcbX
MSNNTTFIGTVAALWRYPVKSMPGEEIAATAIGERGVVGDRAYAVRDRATGHIVSAKHPAKWGRMFACRAAYAEPPQPGAPLPPVWITLPDGTRISSADPVVDGVLSRALGREVTLTSEAPDVPTREADRQPLDGSGDGTPLIREETMGRAAPAGTFFDYAALHLITTATLDHLHTLDPACDWDVRRFRPNIVLSPAHGAAGFVENNWLGHRMISGAVQLDLIDPSPRCVVPTLAQGDLPRDPHIVRTLARHNNVASLNAAPGAILAAVAGIYGRVVRGGLLHRGDSIYLE